MKKIISTIREGIAGVIFPNVCLCCGEVPLKSDQHICSFCLHSRFEDANSENAASSSDVILPDGVEIQHALWNFDKGGDLQHLMHHLKYERLISVGLQLGEVLARRVQSHPHVASVLETSRVMLVPVPLHYLKFRKRGFNQAFYIARGVEKVLDIPICAIDAIVRRRFTYSQTGFTLEKRIENMKDAFKVRDKKAVKGNVAIIIDDVFTTGATSFELAKTLKNAGAASIMVWTIAQA